jgi:glucosamine--fructose-6-phosphate aminotransferase (isomerizing)
LDQAAAGSLEGVTAQYYDGTPVAFTKEDVKHTEITSRDIDRQNFPHYFLKEISESPLSVERTLLNRWKISGDDNRKITTSLDKTVVPDTIINALKENRIKRAYFVGQGTAGVAAAACADLWSYYLNDPLFQLNALKASELSGFKIAEDAGADSMKDTLVIAISQSGTTTDTNRTVDMARERGAHIIAIVNRRDSDITFKSDGVMYTSSGRDIEMSVASTKAFYSQIVAGALLGLFIASFKGRRDQSFVTDEIRQLLEIPNHMRTILSMKEVIKASAERLAVQKTYWAVVGSGPNKVAADEIRIKLSELCYKTISTDFVEDKKHIDLSSEPLIIICAAGTRSTVVGDIIKDTAIFQAHKATPVVIADKGDDRFDPYAEDVFHIPVVSEHLALILNTLVGHIWGYYAALAINNGSRFLYRFREELRDAVEASAERGLDVYEAVLERSFKEKIARFYTEFRKSKREKRFPTVMEMGAASDLTLLLKYLAGRLPVSDFEIDFGVKGTAMNMLSALFKCLGTAVNDLARPVDAIKHQAKTVTVGTSRIREKIEGILFETIEAYDPSPSQLINRNILVLKNLQNIVASIKGAILYKISGLDVLGELTDDTTIEVLRKEGVLKPIPSRVEKDTSLKGSKRIIVKQGNVYIGKGRKDDRSILVIPFISASSDTPNLIEYLLLLNISFKLDVSLSTKIKALGGKYEHIKNIVQENSVTWENPFLEMIPMDDLFGRSAEKIAESILSRVNGQTGEGL